MSNPTVSFFEAIAKSFDGIVKWLDTPVKKDPIKIIEAKNQPNTCIVHENATKKFKVHKELYSSVYPTSYRIAGQQSKDTTILSMEDSDTIERDLITSFHRSVNLNRNGDIAFALRSYKKAKEVHSSYTIEYSRHMTRLNQLNPMESKSVQTRAWTSIEHANRKLDLMEALVLDFEKLIRPKHEMIQKLHAKLRLYFESIEQHGQDAISILVQEIQRLEIHVRSMNGIYVHVFHFISTREIGTCRLVSKTWNETIISKKIISKAIRCPRERSKLWKNAIRCKIPCGTVYNYDYNGLVSRSIDTPCHQHAVIDADVRRTTFIRTESIYNDSNSTTSTRLGTESDMTKKDARILAELHAKLSRILKAYCAMESSGGYCHGMTFLAGGILSCMGYDEQDSFNVFVSCMEHYDMANMFRTPDLPGTKQRMDQLAKLIRLHLPSVATCLAQHKIHPQMYSSGWIMGLFLNEISLSPLSITIILDEFLVGGWPAMFQLYLGLLSIHSSHILTTHHILQVLVQLAKELDKNLMAVLDEGRLKYTITISSLDLLSKNYNPINSFLNYF